MIRSLTFVGLFAVGVLINGPGASAQTQTEVLLSASPRELQVGEMFTLEVRANVKGGNLDDLTFADLKKYPALETVSHQSARPMQVSFGFGSGMKVQSSLSHQYLIRALAPGTYEFSPAVAKVDGKTFKSDPLTVVVLPSTGGTGGAQGTAPVPSAALKELAGQKYDTRAFLRTVVAQEDVYIGQQVDVSVYLYTRIGVSGRSVNPTKPSMDGFWVYDEQITNLDGSIVNVEGVQYLAYLVQKSAAFPQRTGDLVIGAPKIAFDAGSIGLFNSVERVERTGVPVTVHVKPLPQPGPPNAFVGNYSVRGWLDRVSVKTGDAVTLHIEATGSGNVQDLRIELPPISGVRALQPAIKDKQGFRGKTLGGTRSWEWILIAETPGEHIIPPIALNYFDPGTQEYGSSSTGALRFSSAGAAVKPPPEVSPQETLTKRDTAVFGPIRMYSALTRKAAPIRESSWFAWVLALPPLFFILFVIGVSFTRRLGRRKATAGAIQRALIDEARSALRNDDPRTFYDRIVASIVHALTTQTNEAVGGLSNAEIRARLVEKGFDDDLVQRIINELEGADFARFAASGVNAEEMERCLQRTETMIERIRRAGVIA